LISAVLTYGRAAADREIVAIKGSGVHVFRILVPALLVGAVLSLVTLELNGNVAPSVRGQMVRLVQDQLPRVIERLASMGHEITFKKLRMRWEGIEDGAFRDVIIALTEKRGELKARIFARRAHVTLDQTKNLLLFTLEDAQIPLEVIDGKFGVFRQVKKGKEKEKKAPPRASADPPIRVNEAEARVAEATISFDLDDIAGGAGGPRKLLDHRLDDLFLLAKRGDPVFSREALLTEAHRRMALGLACLVFMLIGAPLGMLFSGGSRLLGFLIGFLTVLLVYYPLIAVGEALSESGVPRPGIAMWLGNATLALLALPLLRRVFR
jgi:lipopolysaccharide export system permease protein